MNIPAYGCPHPNHGLPGLARPACLPRLVPLGRPAPRGPTATPRVLLPLALVALAISCLLYGTRGVASNAAQSATVIGSNSLLSEGANALEAGRVEEGVRLTLAGLKEQADAHDIAAGHANVCAGLVLLEQLDAALEHCNLAIEMDSTNWRAFNNRAAVYVAKGLFEQAFRDIKSGLELAPNSRTLHESLRVALRNKRIMERRGRHAVPS